MQETTAKPAQGYVRESKIITVNSIRIIYVKIIEFTLLSYLI